MTYKAILFDKDGTLFDFNKTWANWSHRFLLELSGNNPDLARRLGDAVGFEHDFKVFRENSVLVSHTPHEIADHLLPLLPGATKSGIITSMSVMTAEVPQAEATPLVPLLSELVCRGLVLGVVTNDSEAPTRRHLADACVADAFHMVLASDSGFAPKPAPDMILAFAETTGIEPSQILMIGDSQHDLKAAKAAGVDGLAVLTGIARRAQLAPWAVDVIPSIATLPTWLDANVPSVSAA